ncbi:MAG: NAD-dependent epimerase/dehydratase family protein [Cyclobacteriaceae bacterium]
MKKILITGATGFLGNYLLEAFSGPEFNVTALCRSTPPSGMQKKGVTYVEGDIEDPSAMTGVFNNIDIVIHAAALVSIKPEDNQRMYAVNVLGTRNVVNAALESGVKRLIHISSVAAIGGGRSNSKILNESAVWSGPSEGYGFTKYHAELEIFRAAAEGTEIDIINPSVIVAPAGQNRSSGLLLKLARSRFSFVPEGIVNIIDARDVSDFILEMTGRSASGQRYILNGFTLTWNDFFREVSQRTGKSVKHLTIPTPLALGFTAIQEFIFFILMRPPVLTRVAVKMATSGNRYSTEKLTSETGFCFRRAENTLDWICGNPPVSGHV